MTIDLSNLKALATAAAANQHESLALNDYGMAVLPTAALDIIAETESHRPIDTEDCKSDLNSQPSNGINSEDVDRLIQVMGTLIPYAEDEAFNTCCEEKENKGWTAGEHARGLLDVVRTKASGGRYA